MRFVLADLRSNDNLHSVELRLEQLRSKGSEAGFLSLFVFLNKVLLHPEASKGFVLTYDIRRVTIPDCTFLSRLSRWCNDVERKDTWKQLCRQWRIIVNPGMHLSLARMILRGVFFQQPPECHVCFTTELGIEGERIDFVSPISSSVTIKPLLCKIFAANIGDTPTADEDDGKLAMSGLLVF